MEIQVKRVYEPVSEHDGYRILVDRLWPRGMTREKARIDLWLKEIAPSTVLRNSYHQADLTWERFKERYLLELKSNDLAVHKILEIARIERITLLYSVRDNERNHALLLNDYLLSIQ